ncbi:MAG: hypothetical protein C0518_05315 [Opitutus sp.]|nr:hypothetical protein [Opitutus sp.]
MKSQTRNVQTPKPANRLATKNTISVRPAGGEFPRAYRRGVSLVGGRALVFFVAKKVGVVVPDDAKRVRARQFARVAAGDVGDHHRYPGQSAFRIPQSAIG